MDLFITTFESVAVLLGIGLIGFWIIRKKILPGTILSLLSPLALEIALPSLIFFRIISTFSIEDFPDWWQLPLWWIFFTMIAGGLTFIFSFISKKSYRREFAISLFYQNAIFFPLAILTGIFPNDSSYLVYLFFFALFYPPLLFSTYHFFFKEKERKTIDLKKIFHPVLIVTIIAIIISSANLQDKVPNIINNIAFMLGAMTIPLIMLILGGNIYNDFEKKGKWEFFEIAKFVTIKNIVFPLIFLGILVLIRPEYYIALILIIQAAVPPVTAIPIVIERSGGNRAIVNQYIVVSFILSLITIPLMVSFFSYYFIP